MPELPEVETVRRGLAAAAIQTPVIGIWRSKLKLRTGAHWQREGLKRLVGSTPQEVSRRGKYLIWEFAKPGSKPLGFLIHLGMTGRCGVVGADAPRAKHTHVVVSFSSGQQLRFVDPRRFGGVRVDTLAKILSAAPVGLLGPEPLDAGFSGEVLRERLGTSKRVIRDALLDQRAVAGIGNIYAIEALYRARIYPLVAARRLRPQAWARLAQSLANVLRIGVENGGTTLKDFRNVSGEVGRNQDDLRIYGRTGDPCPGCGTAIESAVHGGRTLMWCPFEQARPRSRWVS
ncbi:MAG: bifunctional DNA-formamidopyrimidine glycosylase/DNA-(apurinic or apyrimidinic site) lyase [Nannocystaceae bacterium]